MNSQMIGLTPFRECPLGLGQVHPPIPLMIERTLPPRTLCKISFHGIRFIAEPAFHWCSWEVGVYFFVRCLPPVGGRNCILKVDHYSNVPARRDSLWLKPSTLVLVGPEDLSFRPRQFQLFHSPPKSQFRDADGLPLKSSSSLEGRFLSVMCCQQLGISPPATYLLNPLPNFSLPPRLR